MTLLLRGGRVVDPQTDSTRSPTCSSRDGVDRAVGEDLEPPKGATVVECAEQDRSAGPRRRTHAPARARPRGRGDHLQRHARCCARRIHRGLRHAQHRRRSATRARRCASSWSVPHERGCRARLSRRLAHVGQRGEAIAEIGRHGRRRRRRRSRTTDATFRTPG